jgi:hypothetical protein
MEREHSGLMVVGRAAVPHPPLDVEFFHFFRID